MPAEAGIQEAARKGALHWIPACAGMTALCAGMTALCAGMTGSCAGMTAFCAGLTARTHTKRANRLTWAR
jgi:hypothetical protein